MRPTTPLALLLLGATSLQAAPAMAGGLGLLGTSGFHQARVYYYDELDRQYLNRQVRPNNGFGLEVVLGDKDDKLLGVARSFFVVDSSAVAPPDPQCENPVYAVPDGPLYVGTATVGLHWGVLGDPTGFQAHIASNVGAAVITVDSATGEGANLEYLLAEAGVGAHYQFARNMQVYADVDFALRYRKNFSPGGNAYLGVRYLFD
jgi:hypothetical protein